MIAFIGVPEKGRNAGEALEEELPPWFDTEFILDILNGRGKAAAKTGTDLDWVTDQVEELDFVEMKDTGRQNPRPVFTGMNLGDSEIVGYESVEDAFTQGFDTVYAAYDQFLDYALGKDPDERPRIENRLWNRDSGFRDAAVQQAEEEGYRQQEEFGDPVNWGVLYPEEGEPGPESDVWMVPEDFRNLAGTLSRDDVINMTYREVAGEIEIEYGDEEELIAETGIPGIYMTVTGGTMDEYGLKKSDMGNWTSRLARFERDENLEPRSSTAEVENPQARREVPAYH